MNGSQYVEQLRAGVSALRVHSLTSYSWFNDELRRVPRNVARSMSHESLRNVLQEEIEDTFYRKFYCLGFPAFGWGRVQPAGQSTQQVAFAEALSRANLAHDRWDGEWRVEEIKQSEIVASRNGTSFKISKEDLKLAADEFLQIGSNVDVRMATEATRVFPGYYVAFGNTELRFSRLGDPLRLYFNLTPDGALILMSLFTQELNTAAIPYTFKVLTDLNHFTRTDSAVLYISQNDFNAVRHVLETSHLNDPRLVRQGVPAFTKCLADGIGLAESPEGGQSFGRHRCNAMAKAALICYENGVISTEAQLVEYIGVLKSLEINISCPYLQGMAPDVYRPIAFRSSLVAVTKHLSQERARSFVEVAESIGEAVIQEAYWSGEQCTWVAPNPHAQATNYSQRDELYSALGGDLYSGTSGIALFLIRLFEVTGDRRFARFAVGALNHALMLVEQSSLGQKIGLFNGCVGVALVASVAAVVLGDERLATEGSKIVTRLSQMRRSPYENDVISGRAGALGGCLTIAKLLDNALARTEAERLGREICDVAQIVEGRYSWRFSESENTELTGFSHGAAGIAHGLIEGFRESGNIELLDAARGAFAFERQWFDPSVGNWADLRGIPRASRLGSRARKYSSFWCHGAPGIGISRLSAFEATGDAAFKEDAIVALDTTYKMMANTGFSGTANFSLCHGLCGNAEVLLEGVRVLDQGMEVSYACAMDVANFGALSFGSQPQSWPCGQAGGVTPSLMCGLSGIGLFYLRLQVPSIPSLLMLVPDRC